MSDSPPPPTRPTKRPVRVKTSEDFDFGEAAPPPRPAVRPPRRQSAKPGEVLGSQLPSSEDSKPASRNIDDEKVKLSSQLEKMDYQATRDPDAGKHLGFEEGGAVKPGSDAETFVKAVSDVNENPGGALSQELGLPVLGPRKAYGTQSAGISSLEKERGLQESPPGKDTVDAENEHAKDDLEPNEAQGKEKMTPVPDDDHSKVGKDEVIESNKMEKNDTNSSASPKHLPEQEPTEEALEGPGDQPTNELVSDERQISKQGSSKDFQAKSVDLQNIDEHPESERPQSHAQVGSEEKKGYPEVAKTALDDNISEKPGLKPVDDSEAAKLPSHDDHHVELKKEGSDKVESTGVESNSSENNVESRVEHRDTVDEQKIGSAFRKPKIAESDQKEATEKPTPEETNKKTKIESHEGKRNLSTSDVPKADEEVNDKAIPRDEEKPVVELPRKEGDTESHDKQEKANSSAEEKSLKPPPRPTHRPKLVAAFESAARESERAAPKPRPKPNVGGRIGQLKSSLFADLNSALERGQQSTPFPRRRSEAEDSQPSSDSKQDIKSTDSNSTEEGGSAEAQLSAMPSNPRARMRGPKRRLPTEAKQKWSTVVSPLWTLSLPKEQEKPAAIPSREAANSSETDHVESPTNISAGKSDKTNAEAKSSKPSSEEPIKLGDEKKQTGNPDEQRAHEFISRVQDVASKDPVEGSSKEPIGERATESVKEPVRQPTQKSEKSFGDSTERFTERDIDSTGVSSELNPPFDKPKISTEDLPKTSETEEKSIKDEPGVPDEPRDNVSQSKYNQGDPKIIVEKDATPESESESFKGSDTSLRRAVAAAMSNRPEREHMTDIRAEVQDTSLPKLSSLLDKPSVSQHGDEHLGLHIGQDGLSTNGLTEDLLRPSENAEESKVAEPAAKQDEEPLMIPGLSHFLDMPRHHREGRPVSPSKVSDISVDLPEAPAPVTDYFENAPPPRPAKRPPTAEERLELARRRIREHHGEHSLESVDDDQP